LVTVVGHAVYRADRALPVVLVPPVHVCHTVLQPGHVHVRAVQRGGLGVQVDARGGLGDDDRDAGRVGDAGVAAELRVQGGHDARDVTGVGEHASGGRAARIVVHDDALGAAAQRGEDGLVPGLRVFRVRHA